MLFSILGISQKARFLRRSAQSRMPCRGLFADFSPKNAGPGCASVPITRHVLCQTSPPWTNRCGSRLTAARSPALASLMGGAAGRGSGGEVNIPHFLPRSLCRHAVSRKNPHERDDHGSSDCGVFWRRQSDLSEPPPAAGPIRQLLSHRLPAVPVCFGLISCPLRGICTNRLC